MNRFCRVCLETGSRIVLIGLSNLPHFAQVSLLLKRPFLSFLTGLLPFWRSGSNLAVILIYSFDFDCLAGDVFSLTEAIDFLRRNVFQVLAAWVGRNLTSNNREYCHFKHSAISI